MKSVSKRQSTRAKDVKNFRSEGTFDLPIFLLRVSYSLFGTVTLVAIRRGASRFSFIRSLYVISREVSTGFYFIFEYKEAGGTMQRL